jgi:hypothetical protein
MTKDQHDKLPWYLKFLTPQTIAMLCAGFASLVLFWNTQKNHSSRLDGIDIILKTKADDGDVKALNERVNRQYETNNKMLDRIINIEKQLERQGGYQDALKDLKQTKQ